jgi:hypothetical protein
MSHRSKKSGKSVAYYLNGPKSTRFMRNNLLPVISNKNSVKNFNLNNNLYPDLKPILLRLSKNILNLLFCRTPTTSLTRNSTCTTRRNPNRSRTTSSREPCTPPSATFLHWDTRDETPRRRRPRRSSPMIRVGPSLQSIHPIPAEKSRLIKH